MSQITTHILDTTLGKPASEVPVALYAWNDDWQALANSHTNADGRTPELLDSDTRLPAGRYRVHFDCCEYFRQLGVTAFYPYVDIVFEIEGDGQHYHIPLLLSPFGYSTYRGS